MCIYKKQTSIPVVENWHMYPTQLSNKPTILC